MFTHDQTRGVDLPNELRTKDVINGAAAARPTDLCIYTHIHIQTYRIHITMTFSHSPIKDKRARTNRMNIMNIVLIDGIYLLIFATLQYHNYKTQISNGLWNHAWSHGQWITTHGSRIAIRAPLNPLEPRSHLHTIRRLTAPLWTFRQIDHCSAVLIS